MNYDAVSLFFSIESSVREPADRQQLGELALPPASLRRLIASLVPTLSACFTKQGKHQNYLNDGLTGDASNSSELCKCWLLLLCLETFINEDGTSC